MVIVDTCIWSEALRKKTGPDTLVCGTLATLISDNQTVLLNPIRQEILSGIKERKTFERITRQLRPFPGLPLSDQTYELAAECFNSCRARGVQGSNTDFLICAAALQKDYFIFTTDKDFLNYKTVLGIKLFDLRV